MLNMAQTLRDRIAEGRFLTGFGVTTADPVVTEMAGYAGFDFVFVEMEHAPLDDGAVLRHLVAARSSGCAALVRVPDINPPRLKPLLDMGPDGILFPFVHNASLARQAVSGCLYPDSRPLTGVRGQGPGRAVCYGFRDEADYLAHPERYLLKLMLIESWEGYRNLDEILAVPGVDGIYIGPGDMARSLAAQGICRDPEELYADICKRVRAAGKLLGAPILSQPSLALAKRSGVQWGVCALDTQLTAEGMRAHLKMVREDKTNACL